MYVYNFYITKGGFINIAKILLYIMYLYNNIKLY